MTIPCRCDDLSDLIRDEYETEVSTRSLNPVPEVLLSCGTECTYTPPSMSEERSGDLD